MLDGLLGRGFTAKCKSLIKLIKSRIDVIRRKKHATQKFLKKDIADLLTSGLDINAFGRAEGLLAELNVSFCYDFVEESCDFVLKHLSAMQKMRECPEDCKEAVSSLMFAAARFSNLPELRDLRQIFYERYGNSLEYFVSQELVEKLSSKPPSMEKKVCLMQDVATEFSIRWDSGAFQQRMSKSSLSTHDQSSKQGSLNFPNNMYKPINENNTIPGEKIDVSFKAMLQCASDEHRLPTENERDVTKRNELIVQPRQEIPIVEYKSLSRKAEKNTKIDNHHIAIHARQEPIGDNKKFRDGEEQTLKAARASNLSYQKRMEYGDGTFKPHGGSEDNVPKREGEDKLVYAGRHLKSNGKDILEYNSPKTMGNVQEEETPKLKPYYNNLLPPPYVKPNKTKDRQNEAKIGSLHLGSDFNGVPADPSLRVRANAGDIGSERIAGPNHHGEHERQIDGTITIKGLDDEKSLDYLNAGACNLPLPKPRSVRRRHHRSSSGQDDVDNPKDGGIPKRRSRSRRRDESKRGLQILFENEHQENNEEERIIDKLLMHYSKKPSTYEQGVVRRKSKSRHREGSDWSEVPQTTLSRDDDMSEVVPTPVRSISLPHEQTTSSESKKVFARAASFQPERSNGARHVHPKLPDYDDLAARFAALKGR